MNTDHKEILIIPKLNLSFNAIETQNNQKNLAINNFNKNLKANKIENKEEHKKLKNSYDPYLQQSKIIKNVKSKIFTNNKNNGKTNSNLTDFFKKQKFKFTNTLNLEEAKQI
jgi:hypothetical protein